LAAAAPISETLEPVVRIRLEYLDGLRGLCALMVVGGHTGHGGYFHDDGTVLGRVLAGIWNFFGYDRYAVAIFIILSGYCLMLPVARSAEGELQGGFIGFVRRRARRILPPYYAALALSLAAAAVMAGGAWQDDPAISAGAIGSHLLLIHNLWPQWMFAINGPMWSVATEWQIYFFFAALLLPIWRARGIGTAIAAAFLVGYTPHFLFHKWLDPVAPWFLGLFALGMWGALVSFSPNARMQRLRAEMPWGWTAAGLACALIVALALKPARLASYPLYLAEPVAGLAAVCLLIFCTRHLMSPTGTGTPFILRLLESRGAVWVGSFSYSLYLIHQPVLDVEKLALKAVALPDSAKLVLLWLVVVPLCVLAAYLFYLPFERPFVNRPVTRNRDRKEKNHHADRPQG
jgi:peptidoglycan/LPS O-acetylase OafA/YrhL